MTSLIRSHREVFFEMSLILSRTIRDRIEEAASSLISTHMEGERARIALPVLYPSGSGSAVDVMVNGSNCFVSDFAFGLMEAEMYGADEFYDSCARKAADRFGVGFDGASVFAAWASLDRLEGAICSVSNASVQAASFAIMRATEEKDKRNNREVFERVREIFGEKNVARQQDIAGREDTWPAHNVVKIPNKRLAVFEYVTANTNSIASKFLMFSDLSKVEDAYSLNSVVKNISSIGPKGSMLADVSNVLQIDSSRDEYWRFLRAA
jgi:hypothetical protein